MEKLQEYRSHVSLYYLNTQSMISMFDEFRVMVDTCNFDIIELPETWLRNDSHILISEQFWTTLQNKGCVGLSITDTIESNKIRSNIMEKVESIGKHL